MVMTPKIGSQYLWKGTEMSNIRITTFLILAGLLTAYGGTAQKAEAQFFGPQIVFDPAAVAEAVKEVAQGAEQIRLAVEDLENQARQLDAITGTRQVGSLFLEPRSYLPPELAELLRTETGGNADVMALIDAFEDMYAPINSRHLTTRGIIAEDSTMARALDRATNANLAALASSQLTYNQVETRLSSVNGLMEAVDESEDLKTSIDLVARVSAENSMLLAELIRMQALDQQARAAAANAERNGKSVATAFTSIDNDERTRAYTALGIPME